MTTLSYSQSHTGQSLVWTQKNKNFRSSLCVLIKKEICDIDWVVSTQPRAATWLDWKF